MNLKNFDFFKFYLASLCTEVPKIFLIIKVLIQYTNENNTGNSAQKKTELIKV